MQEILPGKITDKITLHAMMPGRELHVSVVVVSKTELFTTTNVSCMAVCCGAGKH